MQHFKERIFIVYYIFNRAGSLTKLGYIKSPVVDIFHNSTIYLDRQACGSSSLNSCYANNSLTQSTFDPFFV